jgi:hypothetical protein
VVTSKAAVASNVPIARERTNDIRMVNLLHLTNAQVDVDLASA